MTSESLEPCPFCGARELTITYAIGTEIRHRCDGRVDRPLVTVTAQTEDAAFSAWNTRARPPAQGVDVGKLLLRRAREYVVDALEAHEHTDGRELLTEIDQALATPSSEGEREPSASDGREWALAKAIRRQRFERTRRVTSMDINLEPTAVELDDARAALRWFDQWAAGRATPSQVSPAIGGDYSSLPPTSVEGEGL